MSTPQPASQPLTRAEALESIANRDFSRLTRADLSGASLPGCVFFNASAGGIVLKGARLESASFFGSELAYADFRDADLTGAFFEGCNLKGAKFTGADIRDAHFVSCTTQNVVWHGARNSGKAVFIDNVGGRTGVQPRGRTAARGVQLRGG